MRSSALTGLAAAMTALAVVMSGCSGDPKPSASSSSSSEKSSESEKSSKSKTPTSTKEAAPEGQTISEYIEENEIVQTYLEPGQDGAPIVDLPVPEGWEITKEDLPEGAYAAIVYTAPDADPEFAPVIFSSLSKLEGDVDPAVLLELAPNELLAEETFVPGDNGQPGKLGGYDAFEIAGTVDLEGTPAFAAQKTVVIPGPDALFMLQLGAISTEGQQDKLGRAVGQIEAQTTISF